MHFHPSSMTLIDDEAERIPRALGSNSLLPREVLAPGLKATLVEGIPFSSHLEDDGIAP